MKPLSIMNLTGRPKLWQRASTKALNSDSSLSSSNRILSDRSNNQIITSTSNHCSFFATINDDVSVDEQIVSFQLIIIVHLVLLIQMMILCGTILQLLKVEDHHP